MDRPRAFKIYCSIALLAVSSAAFGQEALGNEGVINLVKSGMSDDLILNVIAKQPTAFSLASTDLVALKAAGVSERLITAMVNKASGGAVAPPPGPGAASRSPSAVSVTEPGIYYRKNNELFELLAEDVEWKTGGAMKSIASAGIIKKDLKGSINGLGSRNFLPNPFEIIISPPTGLTINDYILLPLTAAKAQRQFSVGPVNKASGLAKGAIQFGVEKVGTNAFRMVLQNPLSPGEYGILIPKTMGAGSSSSKMHTFKLTI